ncbi:MAG: hypothetical protein ACPGTU_17630 [Myxococcota bacterium]
MPSSNNEPESPPSANNRLGVVLAVVLVVGFTFAAVRAWGWKDVARHRNLIVIGPETADMSLSGDAKQLSVTDGVYAWSVLPGPYTLTVQQTASTTDLQISIPAGLGGLMLEVKSGPNGDLILGYF